MKPTNSGSSVNSCDSCAAYSALAGFTARSPAEQKKKVDAIVDLLSTTSATSREMNALVRRSFGEFSRRETAYAYPIVARRLKIDDLNDKFYDKTSKAVLRKAPAASAATPPREESPVVAGKRCCRDAWLREETILRLFDDLPSEIYGYVLQLIDDKNYDDSLIQCADVSDLRDIAILNNKDIFELLPIGISKRILSYLDGSDLRKCVRVSHRWRRLANEVQRERIIRLKIDAELESYFEDLRADANPDWCVDCYVAIPASQNAGQTAGDVRTDAKFNDAIVNCGKEYMSLAEKNVYCGEYNVLVIHQGLDLKRVVSKDYLTDGNLVSISVRTNKMILIDAEKFGQPVTTFSGHAGSVTGLLLDERRSFLISSSYDASIRKWSLTTKRYLHIFNGHNDMVLNIAMHGLYLVSGSHDKSCKVWRLDTGGCLRTFWHSNAVSSVAVHGDFCVSGCVDARVRVWQISTGKFVKNLFGHRSEILGIAMDANFIVTCAKESIAFVWSAHGDYKKKLSTLSHPK